MTKTNNLTLVTFIGTGSYVKDNNGNNDGYQKTNYQLPNGDEIVNTTYLGNALYDKFKPQKTVIIGTNGSAWGYLFEHYKKLIDTEFELYEHFDNVISDKTYSTKTDEVHVKQLEDALNREYGNESNFVLRIVKDLSNENDQIDIFKEMSNCIDTGEHLILDITHGYRYMPFFAFITFEFLHLVKGIEIDKILYGTYERNREINPVLDLSYMLDIFNWSLALSKYDSSKDLSHFVELMDKIKDIDQNKNTSLKQFAFFERMIKIAQAKQQIAVVNSIKSEDPVYLTIEKELKERISWSKKQFAYQQMAELANIYLESKDYVRSCIYAFESLRNRCAFEMCVDLNDKNYDDNFDESFKNAYKEKYKDDFNYLRWIRNAIAHGDKPNKKVTAFLDNEEVLSKKLKEIYKKTGII